MIFIGCGGGEFESGRPDEKLPDAGFFDASVGDGGDVQPQADCADVGPHEFNNNFSPYFGGELTVDVEVLHYSSLYCIHCADFAESTRYLWDARPEYYDRVRIYYHHADFVFRHRAAVAAQNQGMAHFWELHDFIYKGMLKDESPSDDDILTYAEKELKLDMARFERDMESDETYSFLVWEIENAQAAGVVATPTAYVCGHQLDTWHQLETDVDDQLDPS